MPLRKKGDCELWDSWNLPTWLSKAYNDKATWQFLTTQEFYYSLVQWKELLLAATKWINLTEIMLSKRSWTQKVYTVIISFLWYSRIKQELRCNDGWVVTCGLGSHGRIYYIRVPGNFGDDAYMTAYISPDSSNYTFKMGVSIVWTWTLCEHLNKIHF